jgi:hypothetical protein
MSYIFNKITSLPKLNIIFLCGSSFDYKNDNDKRKILKEHILKTEQDTFVVILEENFIFGKSNNSFLGYNEIFMKNLKDIEMLTAFFADKVIIIHESISTAAELAAFASDKVLNKKICLLVPYEVAIEEDKISSFLRLAYLKGSDKVNVITFYPEVFKYIISDNHINIRTNFFNNEIGYNLSKKIKSFINTIDWNVDKIDIKPNVYGKPSSNLNIISYSDVCIYVSVKVVIYQMISLFNLECFKTEIRTHKSISDHVSYIEKLYKEIINNTINEEKGKILNINSIIIKEDKTISLRDTIAYSLYLLQAMKLIKFNKSVEGYKITITTDMTSEICNKYKELINEVKSDFNVLG